MKNEDVVIAFLDKQPLILNNISSDGQKLFSYDTCIAEWLSPSSILMNDCFYSNSTRKYQNKLRKHACHKYDIYSITGDVPEGTKSLKEQAAIFGMRHY